MDSNSIAKGHDYVLLDLCAGAGVFIEESWFRRLVNNNFRWNFKLLYVWIVPRSRTIDRHFKVAPISSGITLVCKMSPEIIKRLVGLVSFCHKKLLSNRMSDLLVRKLMTGWTSFIKLRSTHSFSAQGWFSSSF